MLSKRTTIDCEFVRKDPSLQQKMGDLTWIQEVLLFLLFSLLLMLITLLRILSSLLDGTVQSGVVHGETQRLYRTT